MLGWQDLTRARCCSPAKAAGEKFRVYGPVARSGQDQARLRVRTNLRRYGAASFACFYERRMVDQTGIEPVTS